MFREIKGITRKLRSLAAMCLPLSVLVLSACGGGSGSGTSSSTTTNSSGMTGGFICASNCPGSTGGTTTTTTTTTTTSGVASVVIGQTSMTTNAPGTSATTLNHPVGNPAVDPATGDLLIADNFNNRILEYTGIPAGSGASARLVIGQSSFTTQAAGLSASAMNGPSSVAVATGQLLFTDAYNNRVGVYSPVPTASPGTMSFVIGQALLNTGAFACSATGARTPAGVAVGGGKVAVADMSNNRVLIYSPAPTGSGATASLVLGEPDFVTCTTNNTGTVGANTMSLPTGVWTDGTRLVVLDSGNNRVLIWNTFPTTNGQNADLVLGQTNFTNSLGGTSATTLNNPQLGIDVDASGQLLVADTSNNRVLIWKTFPTTNGQNADLVLGQTNFTNSLGGTSATTLNNPQLGIDVDASGQLLVADTSNGSGVSASTFTTPSGVLSVNGHIIVTDYANNRVLIF